MVDTDNADRCGGDGVETECQSSGRRLRALGAQRSCGSEIGGGGVQGGALILDNRRPWVRCTQSKARFLLLLMHNI